MTRYVSAMRCQYLSGRLESALRYMFGHFSYELHSAPQVRHAVERVPKATVRQELR
jgi:hypothetical protein